MPCALGGTVLHKGTHHTDLVYDRHTVVGSSVGLAISRSQVQILLEATLRNNLGQVVHTYVPLSSSSITWYWPKGRWRSVAGEAWRKVMAAYHQVDDLWSPAGWLPRHRISSRPNARYRVWESPYLCLYYFDFSINKMNKYQTAVDQFLLTDWHHQWITDLYSCGKAFCCDIYSR